jgi:hypothetical protein
MVYLTAFTRQVERPASLKAAPELVLGEAPLDAPTPIEAWFPNGGRRGHAFIY